MNADRDEALTLALIAPEVAPNMKDDAIRDSTLHVQAFRKKMNLTEDVCFYQVVYQELYIVDAISC